MTRMSSSDNSKQKWQCNIYISRLSLLLYHRPIAARSYFSLFLCQSCFNINCGTMYNDETEHRWDAEENKMEFNAYGVHAG